jgi:DNA-binding NtrC family response regulator
VHLPPLRERPEDIPLLVEALLGKINRELHKAVRYVAREAMDALVAYRWPGNVRELENMLTRAVVLAKSEVLDRALLPLPQHGDPAVSARGDDGGEVLPLRVVEQRAIERALRATGWNKRRACGLLEISRPTLDRKIEEYGLRRPGAVDEEGPA